MRTAVAGVVKRGLERAGHYARILSETVFPGVVVLAYHGIRDDRQPAGTMPFENLHVRASAFARHCILLRDTCQPISLEFWRAAEAGRAALPPRPVLITFDDAYRSVFTLAAPVLDRLDLPAVVFACSEPSGRRRLLWFDHVAARDGEAAVEAWKAADYDLWRSQCADPSAAVRDDDPRAPMTPAEIGRLARVPGVEIGAHTARHPVLSRAAAAQQRQEIAECRDALAAWTGAPIRAFAYPNGRPSLDYSAETVAAVRELGFDSAFTTNPAFVAAEEPRLERSRFLMLADVTAAELAHRLAVSWPR